MKSNTISLLLYFAVLFYTHPFHITRVNTTTIGRSKEGEDEELNDLNPPMIMVELLKPQWAGIGTYFLNSRTVGNFSGPHGSIMAKDMDYYRLTCTSNYMTKWTGDIPLFSPSPSNHSHDQKLEFIQHYGTVQPLEYIHDLRSNDPPSLNRLQTRLWKIQLLIQVKGGYSGSIRCQSVDSVPHLVSQIYFYVEGESSFSTDPNPTHDTLNNLDEIVPIIHERNGSFMLLIPCKANFPNVRPQLESPLYEKATQYWTEACYDPTAGFFIDLNDLNTFRMSHKLSLQDFDCRDLGGGQSFQNVVRFRMNGLYYILESFRNASTTNMTFDLDLVVAQLRKSVKMTPIVTHVPSLRTVFHTDLAEYGNNYYIPIFTEAPLNDRLQVRDIQSTINCTSNYFDFNSGSQKTLLIKCDFPAQCDFYKPNAMSWDGEAVFIGTGITWSSLEPDGTQFEPSGRISSGIVLCHGILFSNLLRGQNFDYFFTGLDRSMYILSQNEFPTRAILHIHELTQEIFYTDDTVEVTCDALTFLLVSKTIRLMVKYDDGSEEVLHSTVEFPPRMYFPFSILDADIAIYNELIDPGLYIVDHWVNVTDPAVEDKALGYGRRTIQITAKLGMDQIICMSPWANSTDWLMTSRSLKVKVRSLPKIKKKGQPTETVNVFHRGKENILECLAEGEPKPRVTWFDPLSRMVTRECFVGPNGECILKFGASETFTPGIYTCVAVNDQGNDTYEYEVKEEDPSALGKGSITGLGFGVILIVALAAALVFFVRRYLKAKSELRGLTEEEYKDFLHGIGSEVNLEDPETTAATLSFESFVIPESHLVIANDNVLGEGQFGRVTRGFLLGDAVAVKTIKRNTDVTLFKAFLMEVKVMVYVERHPNIVHFCGAVVNRIRERIIFVVVELSPFGNLQSYLRKECREILSGNSSESELYKKMIRLFMNWSCQIAIGMEYLGSKKLVHGDLASRNVLLFKEDVVKISDFGLSTRLYGYAEYVKRQKGPLPWAWMSVEALRFLKFSIQSDVWAYGITIHEIFSCGQFPYPGMQRTCEFVDNLENGLRVTQGKFATENVHKMILGCCENVPENRPTFGQLRDTWMELMTNKDMTGTSDHKERPEVEGDRVTSYLDLE